MYMIKKIVIMLSLVLIFTTSSTINSYAQSAYTKEFVGGNNKSISMKLNKSIFERAEEAILINETAAIDAISVTPLAYAKDAPIITTEWMNLDSKTINYIKKLGVKKITIIGGLRNVSRTTERDLIDMGIEVNRVYGEDRYETSMKIADEMQKEKNPTEVMFLSSTAGLENAISYYTYAAQKNIPILWGKDDQLDKVINFINKKGYETVYAVGNSERFIDEVGKKVKNVDQIKEINKYDTNIQIINNIYDKKVIKDIYTVNMDYGNYAQITEYVALGVVSAKKDIPILVCNESLTYSQEKFIENNHIKNIIEVGKSVGDYSIINILITKTFKSTFLLMGLLTIITIRAFKS